jgi:hypothetical protein
MSALNFHFFPGVCSLAKHKWQIYLSKNLKMFFSRLFELPNLNFKDQKESNQEILIF